MSTSLLTKVSKHSLCHDDDAEKICFNLLAKILDWRIFHRADIPISCIVNQNVQASEGFDRRLDSAFCLSFLGDVEGNCADIPAELVLKVGQLFGLPRTGHDSMPCFQCRHCERATKPPGTPCNQPYLRHAPSASTGKRCGRTGIRFLIMRFRIPVSDSYAARVP